MCLLLSHLVSIATAQIRSGEKHFFTYPSNCARCVVSATVGVNDGRHEITKYNFSTIPVLSYISLLLHFCTVTAD